ncbi:MAG: TonB-dependent receptor [Saprospiraceae bacterium]|nr:TonB-dependent receptor [Saprospiraceae bacterium]
MNCLKYPGFFSIVFFFFVCSSFISAQSGVLIGKVIDSETQLPLTGAIVRLEESELGIVADLDGNFKLTSIPPKSYNITVSMLGYKPETKFNVVITAGNSSQLNFELQPDSKALSEVVVSVNKSTRVAKVETPLSIQNLSAEEIKSNPGGNFDISRVVQALPGVGGTSGNGSFRNDLVIRGGGPNENVYYLDGVEIPVLNHFSTQGAAGGPTGMLNVSFIEDATLSSSAFHARYDNPLSAVLQFKQRDGNKDRFQGNFRLSGTEAALTAEGPLSSKTSFLASARRSYLDLFFSLIDLPIRPNYWDFQYKLTHRIDAKTTITAIGLGAIDEFTFALPKNATPENLYVLSSNPIINQWNYTQGFTLKRIRNKGYWNLTFSRNMFNNRLDRFQDNFDGKQNDESKRSLKIIGQEIENKLRFEQILVIGPWKYSFGANGQYVKYNNDVFTRARPEIRDSLGNIIQPAISFDFLTAIDFFKYGIFGQINRRLLNERLSLSFGIRSDANSISNVGAKNLVNTLSPRLSASYALNNDWTINASAGRYYKLLPYTSLGFRNETGNLVNSDLPYIRSEHLVMGLEFVPRSNLRFTLEGFYKWYSDYPVSAIDGISLANLGGDFGIIGNESILSVGSGNTFGFEFFAQQKLARNLFYTVSYTFFHSRFAGVDGQLLRSAWDTRHLLSLLAGYKFKYNWELGIKYRYQGGTPYTPFDLERSRVNYQVDGRGTLDFTRLNGNQLPAFSQMDLRIDKKWNFKKITFDLFIDVQNLLVTNNPGFPSYTFKRTVDNTNFETTDGMPIKQDGSNAIPIILTESDPTVVPTIGFILEF